MIFRKDKVRNAVAYLVAKIACEATEPAESP
jgi:hypothetical protein